KTLGLSMLLARPARTILTDFDQAPDRRTNRLATRRQGRVAAFSLQDFHRVIHGGGQYSSVGQACLDYDVEGLFPDGGDILPIFALPYLHPVVRCIGDRNMHPWSRQTDFGLGRRNMPDEHGGCVGGAINLLKRDVKIDRIFANYQTFPCGPRCGPSKRHINVVADVIQSSLANGQSQIDVEGHKIQYRPNKSGTCVLKIRKRRLKARIKGENLPEIWSDGDGFTVPR